MSNPDLRPGQHLQRDIFSDGPVADHPRFFNRMWRSARPLGDDVLEVRSYHDMRVRVFCWLFGLLVIALFVGSNIADSTTGNPFEDQIRAFRILTDYRGFLTEEYAAEPRYMTLDAWLAGYDDVWPLHRGHAIFTLVSSFFFLFPLCLVALLWPRRAPLRIDRKRWIAYTMLKGELVLARIGTGPGIATPFVTRIAPPPPRTFRYARYSFFGPLLTGMMGTQSGKSRIFWMGAQPATNLDQNCDLQVLVNLFTDDRADHARWFHLLRRRSFLPGDILRALDHLSLRRRPDLDDPTLQAELERAIPNAVQMGDPVLVNGPLAV